MNKELSADRAAAHMLPLAKKAKVETVWDRFEKQQPQCGFGTLGVCCRICWQGPCRIDPFGEGPSKGICGADADTIVARNLIRGIAGGTAAHSDHGKHIALTLREISRGHAQGYSIKDEGKLRRIAEKLGIATEGKEIPQIAGEVADITLEDFCRSDESIHCSWFDKTLPQARVDRLEKLGVIPGNINASIAEVMARTHIGTDADPVNLLLGGIKCALGDYVGMALGTELSDAIFGTPAPVKSRANLGVIKESAVNIAVHGHNPLLSELVCDAAAELDGEAKKAGAKDGINVVGVCCTGNEVLMRRGIPLATNFLSQELVMVTGALDAMVVDVQCIMPSLSTVKDCFHTELITTMPTAKIPGATHVEFSTETAVESAKKIVRLAIEAYKKRNPAKINLVDITETAYAGFSAEAIVGALSALDGEDPLKPLLDNIVNGNIRGVALFAGCNNPNVVQDSAFITIAEELAKNNVLLLATGCGAGAFAKAGLLTPEATETYAGATLKAVLTAVGQAAGLSGPLPLILHMGSCVDNTRAVAVATALANKIGVDLDQLPVVASAPECMSEKAMAIGTWAVTLGLPTHLGVIPQVLGSPVVTKVLTDSVKDLTGGYFIVETDPQAAARKLLDAIEQRRAGLGI
ncbi:MAG TPA: anaerobic carbon-monoxide dehydrogenase catalytic subunit [Anaerovoracaceae bacterium]|nr:anaerobic carbon-monoxide dehydrogenase catalytic subunit [Anaerovoracaceae bacterium]